MKLQNPKNEESILNDLRTASENDVNAAVDYAYEAFETGPWASFSGEKRGRCLGKLADLIEEYGEEIAYFESIASGRPLMPTKRDIPMFAKVFRCEMPPANFSIINVAYNKLQIMLVGRTR